MGLAERILDTRNILTTDMCVCIHAVVLGYVHVTDGSQASSSISSEFGCRRIQHALSLRKIINRTAVWEKFDFAYSFSSLLRLEYRSLPFCAFRLKTYAKSVTLREDKWKYPYHLKQYPFDSRAA